MLAEIFRVCSGFSLSARTATAISAWWANDHGESFDSGQFRESLTESAKALCACEIAMHHASHGWADVSVAHVPIAMKQS